ncbi:MAG: type II secretion system protein M [Alcanivoracaceae bacterium]|jgi:general secretion pathway protein M|nr:type II secretion system protein M [Alcanivoracaceae bacterium]
MNSSQKALLQRGRHLVDTAQAWYGSRESREQRALQVLALALVLFILYFLIVMPVFHYRADARARFENNAQLYQWIEANRPAMQAAAQNAPVSAAAGDWVARVNAAASQAGIALKGASPEGDNAVRVQMEDQPFAAVVGWLDTMQRDYGGQIRSINITPGGASGTVSLRATLQGAL